MTPEQISEALTSHRKWLEKETGGNRIDWRGAYLQGADLQGAYLRGAYLQGADLQGADLRNADLRGADLRGANLRNAIGYRDGGIDFRGYHFRAVLMCEGIQITAGCRCFSLDEALTHWADNPDALARVGVLALLLK